MIYDAHYWRDTQMTATANTILSPPYGVPIISFPADMERVVSIRGGNQFLDPVTSTFLINTDPEMFERLGKPTMYEEQMYVQTMPGGETAPIKQIRLYPIPDGVYQLLIIGKRTCPRLPYDVSESVIRNIDNCLIAYAMGDMLERMRQYGKAQAKFTEAGAMLEAAWQLEQQQANRPRQTKNLTVSGNSLAELTDAVAARTGAWSPDDAIIIKELLRRNYLGIYDRRLWRESTVAVRVPSDGAQILLPEYVDRVISVRADSKNGEVVPVDVNVLFNVAPGIFEETLGPQINYSLLSSVGVKKLSPTTEKLVFVSTSALDVAASLPGRVFIRGESDGVEVSETVMLNGTTPVQTVNLYDVPLNLSKPVTQGSISITGLISGTEVQRLGPQETERRHIRVWLHPENIDGTTCLILGKRKARPLVDDRDTPLLRDIASALIDLTVADVMGRPGGNAAGATETRKKGNDTITGMIELETKQSGNVQRVLPTVEGTDWEYGNNWLTKYAA